MGIIYVAGRYRARTIFGVIWNIYKARRAAIRLWQEGYTVICPHMNTALFPEKNCFGEGIPYIAGDLKILHHCHAVYMLKGWRRSTGAQAEFRTAINLGLEIIYEGVDDGLNRPERAIDCSPKAV